MEPILDNWDKYSVEIGTSIEDFNEMVKKSNFSIEDLAEDVDQRIKGITDTENSMQTQWESAQRRVDLIQRSKLAPTKRNFTIINVISGCSTALLIIANCSEYLGRCNQDINELGISTFVLGSVGTITQAVVSKWLRNRKIEVRKFKRMSQTDQKAAKTFRLFLTELKKIRTKLNEKHEPKDLQASDFQVNYRSQTSHTIDSSPSQHFRLHPLDTSSSRIKSLMNTQGDELTDTIGNCLRIYDRLPEKYKDADVYSRLISAGLHALDQSHSLNQGLLQLQPITKDMSQEALQIHRWNYMDPDLHKDGKERKAQTLDETQYESTSGDGVTQDAEDLQIETQQDKEKHQQRIDLYKFQLYQYLGIKSDFPYIFTRQGNKINFYSKNQESYAKDILE